MVASFIFIISSLYRMRGDIFVLDNLGRILTLCVIYSLIGSSAVFVFGYALKLNLEFIANRKLRAIEPMEIFIKANLCKYLPGNVMQYVSRNLYAKKIGISHAKMIFGSLLEIFFIISVTFFLCLIFGRELFLTLLYENAAMGLYGILAFAILLVFTIVFFVLKRAKLSSLLRERVIEPLREIKLSKLLKLYLKMFVIISCSFILYGTLFFFLMQEVSRTAEIRYFVVLPAYIVSFLIGFITPGAPGGIGIKESLLLLLLSDSYGGENVLLTAVLFRFVTIMADIFAFLFFMLLVFIRKRYIK